MGPKEPSEADVIFNRASVALAKSQQLVASWLPPRSEAEQKQADDPEDVAEPLASTPGRLGVGATLPKELQHGQSKQTELSSNEKLRKQLLGRYATKNQPKSKPEPKPASTLSVKSASTFPATTQAESSEESDGGRASAFTSRKGKSGSHGKTGSGKRRGVNQEVYHSSKERDRGDASEGESDAEDKTRAKKRRPVSYLDEVLADRQKKRKKKTSGSREGG